MRGRSLVVIGVLTFFGGCQACSDCTDYTSPVRDTAPGEIYAGMRLPAGQPVVPQVLPPGTEMSQPFSSQPTPAPAPATNGYNGMP